MSKKKGKSTKGKNSKGNKSARSKTYRAASKSKKPVNVNMRQIEPLSELAPRGPLARQNECVGVLREENGVYFVDPNAGFAFSQYGKIVIYPNNLNGAPIGMMVVCLIMNPNAMPGKYEGRITEVLGNPSHSDVAMHAIIHQYGLSETFPDAVNKEIEDLPLTPSENDIEHALGEGRKDHRTMRTVTIDGEDAKDLDDAISIEKIKGKGYRLFVHIADVAHYVRENTVLDAEARQRGTSVYLVDRVIPMLPPKLSNGLCSLNPNAPRLAMTVAMTIDFNGQTIDGDIYESVIESDLRTSYNEVYKHVYEKNSVERLEPFGDMFTLMVELKEILFAKRKNKGMLDFSFPETRIDLDKDGNPTDIYPYPINEAHQIIEAFMIACNEFVASRFEAMKAPFIYRIHEEPDVDKIKAFMQLAKIFGAKGQLKGSPTPKFLADLMEQIREEAFAPTLSQLLLRSLAKARYSENNAGHFGLYSESYSHFTSPIRRYPDLYIHRIIKSYLQNKPRIAHFKATVPSVSTHSSDMERNAIEAERASVDRKAAEYMVNHLGDRYDGLISGMMQAGMFVRLESSVEGMVPFRTMDDYYEYDPVRLEAVGKRTGKKFKLGQPLRIIVAAADPDTRRIDFEIESIIDNKELYKKPSKRRNKADGQKKNKKK